MLVPPSRCYHNKSNLFCIPTERRVHILRHSTPHSNNSVIKELKVYEIIQLRIIFLPLLTKNLAYDINPHNQGTSQAVHPWAMALSFFQS